MLITLLFSTLSCTEEIDFETQTFESALVVQASLTNENKIQQVVLSRTFPFEADGPPAESGATILITSDAGVDYMFQESPDSGIYKSTTPFAAIVGRSYTLNITTSNGRNYQSEPEVLKAGTSIGQVYAERDVDSENNVGVSILLDAFDPGNNSKYYRFEYEETYKIVSQFTSQQDLIINENQQLVLVPKTEEEQICYNTIASKNIALATTNSLAEDRLTRYPINFLDVRSPKVGNRYSILVRQYVISRAAFDFYETLKSFSDSESLFSQVQPGFIRGNIASTENESEKVIGFFDVSTVSEKRIFFNFQDLFSDGYIPQPFSGGCETSRPSIPSLFGLIQNNSVKYYFTPTEPPAPGEGPYTVLPTICIDCRTFGSNVVPDFWEE